MREQLPSCRRLWGLFTFVVLASFAVLGGYGFRIASEAPDVPAGQLIPERKLANTP